MLRRLSSVCLCLAALTVGAAPGQAAPRYVVTDLGTLPGGVHSGAYGINGAGQIVGWSDGGTDNRVDPLPHLELIHNHAVVWDKGRMLDLGLLRGFPFSAARAINGKGQVVGGSDMHYLSGGGAMFQQTFLWQSGHMTFFNAAQPPSYFNELTAINNRGEMVGEGFPGNIGPKCPVLWFRGKLTGLKLFPGGREGIANGINNKGEIVGWVMGDDAASTDWLYRAFLYRNGKMINLGAYPIEPDQSGYHLTGNYETQAFAINDKGQVVGRTGDGAALWENGTAHLLDPPTDNGLSSFSSVAYAINNRGQIVGDMSGGYLGSPAFLYQDGKLRDLNGLIPAGSGWVLKTARGINDRGQIVGSGEHAGKERAYLLTPIP